MVLPAALSLPVPAGKTQKNYWHYFKAETTGLASQSFGAVTAAVVSLMDRSSGVYADYGVVNGMAAGLVVYGLTTPLFAAEKHDPEAGWPLLVTGLIPLTTLAAVAGLHNLEVQEPARPVAAETHTAAATTQR